MIDVVNVVFYTTLGVVIFVLVVVILERVYNYLKHNTQGYPKEEEIEAFVLPIIYNAIFSAFKASEYSLNKFNEQLSGADKKLLADSVYDLMPSVITIGGVCVPMKSLISREKFSELVQLQYDKFLLFYRNNELQFTNLMEQWLKENK